jgi:UTP:GlnB (protein PII) uridylyltransferase
MKGCTQNSYHHLDVWQHSLATLENCEYIINRLRDFFAKESEAVLNNLNSKNRIPLIKLSAILHDIGKPTTRKVDPATERITFYQHDREGEKLGSAVTHRLRMSKRDRDFIRALIGEHLHVRNLSHPQVKTTTIMSWFRKFKDDSVTILILGMADSKATLGELSSDTERETYLQWSKEMVGKYYRELKEKLKRRDFINGNDLLALGISPGPQMGQILRKIRAAQDGDLIKNRKDALIMARNLIHF